METDESLLLKHHVEYWSSSPVSEDTNERSSDVDNWWFESINTGESDHLSQTISSSLLQLWRRLLFTRSVSFHCAWARCAPSYLVQIVFQLNSKCYNSWVTHKQTDGRTHSFIYRDASLPGAPLRIDSLNIGRRGAMPLGRQNPGSRSSFRSAEANLRACLMSATVDICWPGSRLLVTAVRARWASVNTV